MPSYYPTDSQVDDRQLKVQRLVIPFTVTGSATSANVVLRTDEPSIMFLRSEGVDQITVASGALASGETATFTTAPVDATGILNCLVKLNEVAVKVVEAYVWRRDTGAFQAVFLGDADGLSSLGKIMLAIDSNANFTSGNLDASLCVSYIISE